MATAETPAHIGIIMGSQSDWETMQHACSTLESLGIAFECRVVSAHRTPDLLFEYASTARAWTQSGDRWRRWRGSFAWDDCIEDRFACTWRAC
jgi:hypothetical protein